MLDDFGMWCAYRVGRPKSASTESTASALEYFVSSLQSRWTIIDTDC